MPFPRLARLLLPLACVPLLSACVNDGAAYQIESKDHALSLMREQPWPWSRKIKLYLVVARMPVCMRRHELPMGTAKTRVEIWQAPSGAFIVKVGNKMFVTETQTCVNFAPLEDEPPEGLGRQIGTFLEEGGELRFIRAPQDDASAPGKPAGTAG